MNSSPISTKLICSLNLKKVNLKGFYLIFIWIKQEAPRVVQDVELCSVFAWCFVFLFGVFFELRGGGRKQTRMFRKTFYSKESAGNADLNKAENTVHMCRFHLLFFRHCGKPRHAESHILDPGFKAKNWNSNLQKSPALPAPILGAASVFLLRWLWKRRKNSIGAPMGSDSTRPLLSDWMAADCRALKGAGSQLVVSVWQHTLGG